MSPVCPSIPVLLGPLMLKSHKLEFVFRQVELFSCRHWQRELFQAFIIQQQVRTSCMTAFVKHTTAVVL